MRVDQTADDIAHRIKLTRELTLLGHTAQQIAWDLGVSKRTVVRYRNGKTGKSIGMCNYGKERVLEFSLSGLSNKEIAAKTMLSIHTVASYRSRLRYEGRLGCCGRDRGCVNLINGPCPWTLDDR